MGVDSTVVVVGHHGFSLVVRRRRANPHVGERPWTTPKYFCCRRPVMAAATDADLAPVEFADRGHFGGVPVKKASSAV